MDTLLDTEVHPSRDQQNKSCLWGTVIAYANNRTKRLQKDCNTRSKLQRSNKGSQDDLSECLHNKYSQGDAKTLSGK